MKTNFKHSKRKIMPSIIVFNSRSSNTDRVAVNCWTSKDADRQCKMFDKTTLDWGFAK